MYRAEDCALSNITIDMRGIGARRMFVFIIHRLYQQFDLCMGIYLHCRSILQSPDRRCISLYC